MLKLNNSFDNHKKRKQINDIFGGEGIKRNKNDVLLECNSSISIWNSSLNDSENDYCENHVERENKSFKSIDTVGEKDIKNLEFEDPINNYKNDELLIYPGLKMLVEIGSIIEDIFQPLKEVEKTIDMKERFARQAFYSITCEKKFENTNELAQQQFQVLKTFIEIINQTYDMNSYTIIDFKEICQHNNIDVKFNIVINLGKFIKTIDLKTSHFCPGERCILTFYFMDIKDEKCSKTEKIGYISVCYFEDDNTEVDKLSIDINFSFDTWSSFTTSDELLTISKNATTIEFSLCSIDKLSYNDPRELKESLDKAIRTPTGRILANMLLNNPPELDKEKEYLIDKNLEIKSEIKLNDKQEHVVRNSLTNIPILFVKSPPGTGKTFTAATIVNNDPTKHTFFIAESNQACNSFSNIVNNLNSTNLKPLRLLSKNIEIKKGKDFYYEEENIINETMKNIENKLSFKDKEIVNRYNELNEKWKDIKWRLSQDHETLKNHISKMIKITKKYEEIFFKIYKCNLIIMTADYTKKIFQSRSYNKFKPQRIIIDEASQMCLVKFLELFLLYPNAQYIFFGDEKQLPPFVPYNHDYDTKLTNSILTDSIMNVALKTNYSMNLELDSSYRMHPFILKFVSKFFYNNLLKCGIDSDKRSLITKNFINLKIPILFINTLGTSSEVGNKHSLINDGEVEVVIKLLTYLKEKNIPPNNITIISMYRSQVENIIEKLDDNYTPQICTVDSFQGSENEIIIVCTTKADISKNSYASSFLKDENRINVAFSRAKSGLFILGDRYCLSEPSIWNSIIRYLIQRKQFCHCEKMKLFFS
uniref:Regulator of nonsense transcripts 1 n=2 Tax=Strongyloides stercoralis TaxID=6248 RepID=A0A0K0E2D2_STRER